MISSDFALSINSHTLMLWICIQFYMFPLNFMSTAFFIFGICQAATGYVAWTGRSNRQTTQEAGYEYE